MPRTRACTPEGGSGKPSTVGKPQRDAEVDVAREERARDVDAGAAQVMFGDARDARIGDAVDELPEVQLQARAKLPCEATPLVLLLVDVAEGRLDVRGRDARAAADDRRATAAARGGETVRDVAEEEIQPVRLLEGIEIR